MTPARQLLGLLLTLAVATASAQSNNRNYVVTRTYQERGLSEASGNLYAGTPFQVSTQLDYFGGLGQATQSVAAFMGPAGQDLIVRTDYDNQYRPIRSYLPVAIGNNTGQFVDNPSYGYYSDAAKVGSPTGNAFTETRYESAPLNRPLEQKAPGVSTGVRSEYRVNHNFTIKKYHVSGPSLRQVSQNGDYGTNTLTYTEVKDENDNTVLEFRDTEDRVVLKQVQKENENLDTYYVYDLAGQLRAVLQPQFQQDGNLDKYAFLYEYNNRGLLIKKKVPGSGEVTMSYDGRDRMTGMADANGKNFYYQYDELNRQTEMGVDGQPLLYTYYDNYGYGPPADFNFNNEFNLNNQDHFVGDPRNGARRGLVTGTKARELRPDGSLGDWLLTVTYYDNKARAIQSVRQLSGLGTGAYERVSYQLDFTGQPLRERTTQGSSSKTYELEKAFEYDHADRLVRTRHTFKENGAVQKQYIHNEQGYNEVGQLAAKWLHAGLQGQNMKYHVRGWLHEVGNPGGPRLKLGLSYNANGNIGSLTYETPTRTGGMNFGYDRASRLTSANGTGNFAGHDENNLGYDRNGNLTSLNRSRPGNTFDQLQYQYDGNQLHRVSDAGGSEGFTDGANAVNEMAYDGNGNLTKDQNRGIGEGGIQYNVLNLARYVNRGGRELRYTYDATGTKHQLQAPDGTTFYAGAFEYRGDGTLLRIGLEEGQLVRDPNGDTYTLHYYLKDHLGNVRAVIDEGGQTVQETEYYAFGYALNRSGEDKNKYTYNGKEKQPETGWLDYGARQYDATLGRWMNADPLSEKFVSWSTYNYAFNNPIKFIDPDGMAAMPLDDYFNKDGKYLGSDNASTDNVKIIDQKIWDKEKNLTTKGVETIEHEKGKASSQKFSESVLSTESTLNVYQHYNTTDLALKPHQKEEKNKGGMTFVPTKNGTKESGYIEIRIEGNKSNGIADHANEITNIFVHEAKHYSDFKEVGYTKFNKMDDHFIESRAIHTQIQHPSFSRTRQGFQKAIIGYGRSWNMAFPINPKTPK